MLFPEGKKSGKVREILSLCPESQGKPLFKILVEVACGFSHQQMKNSLLTLWLGITKKCMNMAKINNKH